MSDRVEALQDKKSGKELYNYQQGAIQQIFEKFDTAPSDYHLLYQLPTGGGKTVIFSEMVRQYLKNHDRKVLVMTHRIELCNQTSTMLTSFGVENKVVNSKANLDDQANYSCFVAMVETLNNRLNDGKLDISDIGLVIIDEAHYNSFTKLFKFFETSFILGVTATPLSSNKELPMKDNYNELIAGETIEALIENEFLARAEVFQYDMGLTSLEVGSNGDYTVKSSEDLYSSPAMLQKLVDAYKKHSLGKKTLIFNNGINTSINVYYAFRQAGIPIMHLDNTATKKQRAQILQWFKETPNAILTSVSILTTGFDEPTIDTIILNRATKSLTLYYQMIGRGSRILNNKSKFTVVDLGNNYYRFGPWGADLDWQMIFKSPNYYIDRIQSDESIEAKFRHELHEDIQEDFAKSEDTYFDVKQVYIDATAKGESSKVVLERSIEHHAKMCIENSEDVYDAIALAKLLKDDINNRIAVYAKCISKSTHNFISWLKDDYKKKLNSYLRQNFDDVFEQIHGYPPED
ncbi:DEAD/DEAH box helicase [Winogradskyella immobilis]|uniref:DEAD/DEAH box helicase family protein n=1 Tax=Winogradskyella immobilis TaxID=2816852 RepID=A0ABS8ENC5_9FLAO|nr:DEAD/DEAH box helicase family protein [Winogradskyella immobilis]MCC1484648.1 DEAD/DEAH box helicase family protein [Winogradskyella immobilis]MCG0016740.1 DEAD/DEAH box helicase family protein [Winogradskyella immobilis]